MNPHPVTTHRLAVPGACLYYEVRGAGPVLLMIGLPMGSTGYAALARLFADTYTVITYDPRGISASTIDDPEQDLTPELVADDVHCLLAAVTTEPAYVFGSSGGAITGLALVCRHPAQVHTLIAHEPPLVELLSDRRQVRAAIDDVYATFRRDGQAAAWPKFFAVNGFPAPAGSSLQHPVTAEPSSAQPLPDGERVLAHCLRPTTRYRPDFATLRAAATRIVVGAGTTSAGQMPHRAAAALADQLGTPLMTFPGNHIGPATEPALVEQPLRRVLSEARHDDTHITERKRV